MSATGERRIALAAVAGAHGVKGELRLKLFTDDAGKLRRYQPLYVAGEPRRLVEVRTSGKMPVARFEGITDRSAAEALRGALVEVDRSSLPPLEPGEYYHADLVGLPATDAVGNVLGSIVTVENYGAGDLLEIETSGGVRSLVPFKVGIAELSDGKVVIDPEFLA